MKQFAIVTPIYKSEPDIVEIISLKRMYEVLKNTGYDIYFIYPKGLDISKYYELVDTNIFKELELDKKYFESTYTYSQLCLSHDFYKLFKDYEYIYIYQLDVYLRENHFEEFCKFGYDYIGSPVLSTDCGWITVTEIDGEQHFSPVIGNGGFSLRKVSTFMEITNPNGEFIKHYNITQEALEQVQYEDLYFCEFVPKLYDINIAPLKIGLIFSWDMSADVLYNQFELHNLPMAIHAWDKNIRFWKKIIEELNNKDIIEFCENKYKDFFKLYYDENDSSFRE